MESGRRSARACALLLTVTWLSRSSRADLNATTALVARLDVSGAPVTPLPQLRACVALKGFSPASPAGAETLKRQCNQTSAPANPRAKAPSQAATELAEIAAPADVALAEASVGGDSGQDEAQPNFALEKDGAKAIAHNPGAKKVSAILDGDSDTFMRNDCSAEKWVVLELSQASRCSILGGVLPSAGQPQLLSRVLRTAQCGALRQRGALLALDSRWQAGGGADGRMNVRRWRV